MSKGDDARKALLDGQAARDADNAAAAREDAMRGKCPVIALGKVGETDTRCVYYSIPHGRTYVKKPNEHTRAHLVDMAPRADYVRWLEPDLSPDAVDGKIARIMREAGERLQEESGGKQYNPDKERGRGVWNDADGVVYNAGDACFLVRPDGRLEQVDAVRGGCVYVKGVRLIHPADDALTDEEGARLADFFTARSWVLPYAGELVAGWMACALLAGVLPFRPQVWVNAPAGAGKSALMRDILRALGGQGAGDGVSVGHAIQFEGGGTSPAAIHQSIKKDSMPVLFDEAESNGAERSARNLAGMLDLVRSAATSGDVGLSKGGADGMAKNYKLRCCFLLFSIANNLDRAADTSRFLVLRLSPLMDAAARAAMWQSQEAARTMTQGQDFTARLFTRLLRAVPALLDNARAIRKHLMDAKCNPRRAEMLGLLLAGAHALTKSGAVDDAYLEHAATVAKDVEETQEHESDPQRCLDALLGYSMPWTGGGKISVAQLCEVAARETDTERKQNACRALEALGLRWRGDLDALQVNTAWRGLRELYKGTEWESGRGASMLAEGCKRDRKPNALGVWLQSCKVSGRPVWLPMIPAALVLPADG